MDPIGQHGDELMPSRPPQHARTTTDLSYDSLYMGPNDELRPVADDHEGDDEFTSTSSRGSKKKSRDRPWKKADDYESIQTDHVDVCGVKENDDDLSYEEPGTGAADVLGLGLEDVSSRWGQNPSSPKEVKDAHARGVSLAASRIAKKQDFLDIEADDDLSISSRKSATKKANQDNVRMEALKLLELANRKPGEYIVKETPAPILTGRFSGIREKTALKGLGLGGTKGQYERVNVPSADVFNTNPKVVSSPVGKLTEVQFVDDEELDDRKKTWGSRYSVDHHLLAIHGGLTSEQVLNKMDRDHYNNVNKNTSANNMFKTSPHEIDDRWDVSRGRKDDEYGGRMWWTWVANLQDKFSTAKVVVKGKASTVKNTVKDKVAAARNRADENEGSHTLGSHRYADHSSPKKGIFTGIAITNFLDRLSPRSKEAHLAGDGADKNFSWRNVNLVDNSRELPDMNFSAGDDFVYERQQKRKKMFWLAVLLVTFIALISIIGTTVSKSSGSAGSSYVDVGETVRFFVISDIPFNKADETKLSRELDELDPKDGDFLIHLGDINKASSTLCTFSVYDDAAALLKQSPVPVLVLPGDNDWNDCPMPEAAFDYWMEKLNRFENNFSPSKFPESFPSVDRQLGRDENFAFLHKGVLFIGVHLVDGTVQSEREWSIRDQENVSWVEQQLNLYSFDQYRAVVLLGHAGYSSKVGDFFWPVMDDFRRANKPVLYLHANDGEGMIEYHPAEDFKKFTAVRLEVGSKVTPTQITVGGGAKPFSYEVTKSD